MRHLKKFENSDIGLVANPKWEKYVTDLFNQYIKLYSEEDSAPWPGEVISFFNDLQDEIDDSTDFELFKVSKDASGGNIFYGISRAYGPYHALVKVAISQEDPDIIDLKNVYSDVISEEDVERKIKYLEEEIKEWKTIY